MTPGDRPPGNPAAHTVVGFDGLRALAALAVLSYHVAQSANLRPGQWYAPLLWELNSGVAIFFAISGALLYLPYARAISGGRSLPDWRDYVRRRAVRILPAYWVVLTAVALGPFHAGVFGPDVGRYYGLSQIYFPRTALAGLSVAWSLCVEVSFYALLPLFAWLLARLVRRADRRVAVGVQFGSIVALGLGSVALRWALAGSLNGTFLDRGKTLMVTLPGLLDWFAVGMSLAVLRAELEAGRAERWSRAVGRRPGLCALLSFAAFMAAAHWQHGDLFLGWDAVAPHVTIGLGSGLLVLGVIVARPGRGATKPWTLRFLERPCVAWIGIVSYGVYLWHLPLLRLIASCTGLAPAQGAVGQLLLLWAVVMVGGLSLGAASYYLVERPCQKLFRSRGTRHAARNRGGRMTEIDASVQSTVDPLNSSGVAVDHLA